MIRRYLLSSLALVLFLSLSAPLLYAQPTTDTTATLLPDRPTPNPVTPPPDFQDAIEQGTRTMTGEPGPEYWTNTADYTIDATLDPDTALLSGHATIDYHNNAPDSLQQLVMHLRQNLHKEGTIRNRSVQITGGMDVSTVIVEDDTLSELSPTGMRRGESGYAITDTRMIVIPPSRVAPDESTTLAVDWSFEIPEGEGAPRMGHDDEVFYLGYWYPQMAVYDDLAGWVAEPYQGNGEFYMGYGSYDVSITVPEGWLVGGTGTLQNESDVLTHRTRDRLAQAADSDTVVTIVGPEEREVGTSTAASDDGTLTWRFQADDVRDFAFSASDRHVWDATTAATNDPDQPRTMIHALYRPDTRAWNRAAEFAQFSIEHLADMLIPYPYPHMTVVEGAIGGGMEYPMITLIGGNRTDRSLFNVTYHEISHMWFPMLVGSNEKRYMWMDEGTTTFNTAEGYTDFFDEDGWLRSRQFYLQIAGTGREVESMRHADQYPPDVDSPARTIASYSKPGLVLRALKGMVEDDAFYEAYRTFAERWTYKHPAPHDLFHTFEDVLDMELGWFWRTWLYETWTLDHAIEDVETHDAGTTVTITDEGNAPMPVPLRVTYANGDTEERMLPVDPWLAGNRGVTTTFTGGPVERITIDPEQYFPYLDRATNSWTAETN